MSVSLLTFELCMTACWLSCPNESEASPLWSLEQIVDAYCFSVLEVVLVVLSCLFSLLF